MVTDQEVRCGIGPDRLNHAAGHRHAGLVTVRGGHRIPSGLTYKICAWITWMVTDPEVRYGIGPDRLNHAAGHSVQVRSHKGCHRIPSGLTYRICWLFAG